MKQALLTIAAMAATSLTIPIASAQVHPNRLPTNLPGITTAVAPPTGFDPSLASDAELARFGFPPKPDAIMQPIAFSSWSRATSSKQRIVPKLELTNVFHRPAQAMNSAGTSNNWSGSVVFGGAQTYNDPASFRSVSADYVVPVARQAYGACTGSWDYSASWVGIDGAGSHDVLQAGTESDAFCSQAGTASFYAAWIEWFPAGSVRISNLPIGPGDDLYVYVWSTSPVDGHAYIANFTTDQAVNIEFAAPAGTSLIGNSAEWVVERPGLSSGLATLTNYISDYFSNCFAITSNQTAFAPGDPSALQLTMLDDQSKPISLPNLMGQFGIWFSDSGSARQ